MVGIYLRQRTQISARCGALPRVLCGAALTHSAIEGLPMSFAIYIVGLAVLIGGIAWGLVLAGVATTYIAITCLIIGGIGIMMAVSRTRTKDPPV
jgi:hypothetical protein